MTTAPKLIREQLLEEARLRFRDSDAAGDVLDWLGERVAARGAEPVGGEIPWRADGNGSFVIDINTLIESGRYDDQFAALRKLREKANVVKVLTNDTQPDSAEGDWIEDFSHENGDYENICCHCGKHFRGHKRRVTCKRCIKPLATNEGKVLFPVSLSVEAEQPKAESGEAQQCATKDFFAVSNKLSRPQPEVHSADAESLARDGVFAYFDSAEMHGFLMELEAKTGMETVRADYVARRIRATTRRTGQPRSRRMVGRWEL